MLIVHCFVFMQGNMCWQFTVDSDAKMYSMLVFIIIIIIIERVLLKCR